MLVSSGPKRIELMAESCAGHPVICRQADMSFTQLRSRILKLYRSNKFMQLTPCETAKVPQTTKVLSTHLWFRSRIAWLPYLYNRVKKEANTSKFPHFSTWTCPSPNLELHVMSGILPLSLGFQWGNPSFNRAIAPSYINPSKHMYKLQDSIQCIPFNKYRKTIPIFLRPIN